MWSGGKCEEKDNTTEELKKRIFPDKEKIKRLSREHFEKSIYKYAHKQIRSAIF